MADETEPAAPAEAPLTPTSRRRRIVAGIVVGVVVVAGAAFGGGIAVGSSIDGGTTAHGHFAGGTPPTGTSGGGSHGGSGQAPTAQNS